MSMKRSDPPSSDSVKGGELKPWERDADLADAKARGYFVDHSGHLALTNHDFKALTGILEANTYLGLNCSPILLVFRKYEELTPDTDSKSRKDFLQMFTPSKIIIPGVGAGALGGVEEKPGLIRGAWRRLTGKGEGGDQT